MSHSLVDAQIRAHVSDILSEGRMTDRAIDKARALYASFTQPSLDLVLDSLKYDGEAVRKIFLFGRKTDE